MKIMGSASLYNHIVVMLSVSVFGHYHFPMKGRMLWQRNDKTFLRKGVVSEHDVHLEFRWSWPLCFIVHSVMSKNLLET
jgi:hypothetical protein